VKGAKPMMNTHTPLSTAGRVRGLFIIQGVSRLRATLREVMPSKKINTTLVLFPTAEEGRIFQDIRTKMSAFLHCEQQVLVHILIISKVCRLSNRMNPIFVFRFVSG
jgi:hypothetical protein